MRYYIYFNHCQHEAAAGRGASYPPELLVLWLRPAALQLARPLSAPPLGREEREEGPPAVTGDTSAWWRDVAFIPGAATAPLCLL